MKNKILTVLLMAAMSISLMACSSDSLVTVTYNGDTADAVAEAEESANDEAGNDDALEAREDKDNQEVEVEDSAETMPSSDADADDKDEVHVETSGNVVKSEDGCFIDDQCNFFTKEEKEVLLSYLDGLCQFGTMGVVTIDKNTYNSTKEFAKVYYDDNITSEEGLLFIIDMQYRSVYLCTRGENMNIYLDDQTKLNITNSAAVALSEERYYDATRDSINYIANRLGVDLNANESYIGTSF